jgi:hypothetical protein
MASKTSTVIFFGDQERTFKLTPNMIVELERLTGVGIGMLSKRVFSGQYAYRDLIEVIRLALIGGGTEPKRAQELVETYCHDRPISEFALIAVSTLSTLMLGPEKSADETTDAG